MKKMVKNTKIYRRKNHLKQFSATFLILCILLVTISLVSAANFDNRETFDKNIGDYGKYYIRDWFGLLKLQNLELVSNSEICYYDNCNAKIPINHYQNGILVEDIRFIDLKTNRIVEIKDYQLKIDGKNYNMGDEVLKGDYNLEIIGELKPFQTVDWQIKVHGKWLDDWAVWTSSLNENLAAYYNFQVDKLNQVNDISLNISNFQGNPAIVTTGCKIGNCVNISSNNDNLMMMNNTLYDLFKPNRTLSFWFKGNEGATGVGTDLMQTKAREYTFRYSVGQIQILQIGSAQLDSSPIPWGRFVYIVVRTNDTHIDFYVNNTKEGTIPRISPTGSAGQLHIGSNTIGTAGILGLLDEMSWHNRSLSDGGCTIGKGCGGEIGQMYNSFTGITFPTLSVILNSPNDNFISTANEVIFNCTGVATVGTTVVNISWWDNRTGTFVLNETEDFIGIGGGKNISIFTKNLPGESLFDWTCKVFNSDDEGIFGENRTISVDTGAPIVNIISPIGIVNYGKQGFNISLNWTVLDSNLDTCWYLYNSTNTTVTCLDLNTTVTLQENQQNIIFYANDSVSNLGSDFIEWEYLVFETSRTFNLTTIETSIEAFVLNVDVLNGFNIQKSELIYNNTIFLDPSIVDLGGGNFNILRSITIPQGNQGFSSHNNTWLYNITIANDVLGNTTSFQTGSSEQKVNELSFGFCGAGDLDVPMLNFTFVNELDGLEINATMNATTFQATFLLGLDSDNLVKIISINNISTNASRFNFCTEETTNKFVTDMQLFYTAEGFTDKNYFLNSAPLTNVTNEIDLFLIDEGIGIEFFIDVEQNLFPLTGATISIAKFFVGESVFKTIEIDTTDGDGRITAFLDLNKDYRFTITKDGELLAILDKRAICDAAPCELSLSITDATPDVYSGFSEVFASQVLYNLSFSSSTKVVTFEFIDITGLATSFRMDIIKGSPNGTGQLVSTQRLFTSSGSMTFDASNESGDFTAKVFITRSPDQLIDFITFIISEVVEVLGILGLFVAFLIVVTVIFGFAFSPRVFIFAIPLSLTLTKLMGIISLSNGAIVVIYLLAIVAATFISR